MRFNSLQTRLSLLFAAFTLLVLISVGAMVWGMETQRQDALIINQAGRQRMLTQQMVRQAENLQHPRLLGSALDTLAQIQLAQKEVPAARASLERALHLPAVQEETSLHAELLRHLAFVQLAGGETEAAESTLAHLPADESPAACIEFWLISGWLAWRRKDQARAEESLAWARDRMETSGCFLYRQAVQRLERALQGESVETHWVLV